MPGGEDTTLIGKIAGIYTLGRKLGAGSFGDIYFAVNSQTGEELAVKFESAHSKYPMLMYEAKLLRHLQGLPGIATMHYSAREGDYNVMVMDLLGPSLEDLFNICHRKFTSKTILMIADQMLHRIEALHSKNFIHRDIKPENFLIGHKGNKSTMIHLIDFGLAKKYWWSKSPLDHVPCRENKSLTGTARYASINAHCGLEQSRRDDLEAIGYVLLYFSRGRLPWQGFQAATKEEKFQKIMESKRDTPVEVLCQGSPAVFGGYLTYCRALRFEDKPNYAYLRRLFKNQFMAEGCNNDCMFDWSLPLANPSSIAAASSELQGNCSDVQAEKVDQHHQEAEEGRRQNNNLTFDREVSCQAAAFGSGGIGAVDGRRRHSGLSSMENIGMRKANSRMRSVNTMETVATDGDGPNDEVEGGGVERITEKHSKPIRNNYLGRVFGCFSRASVKR